MSLSGLGIKIMLVLWSKLPSLPILLNLFWIWIICSLKFGRIYLPKQLFLGIWGWEIFDNYFIFSKTYGHLSFVPWADFTNVQLFEKCINFWLSSFVFVHNTFRVFSLSCISSSFLFSYCIYLHSFLSSQIEVYLTLFLFFITLICFFCIVYWFLLSCCPPSNRLGH